MPTYNPTITNPATSFLQVTMLDTVTYQQFLQSLGSISFDITDIYLSTTTMEQIQQVYDFEKFDANGDKKKKSYVFAPDPYQRMTAFIQPIQPSDEMIFDSRSFLKFPVLANEYLIMKFYYNDFSLTDLLDEKNGGNMKKVFDFFDSYQDVIT
jgi:hypothetical protein